MRFAQKHTAMYVAVYIILWYDRITNQIGYQIYELQIEAIVGIVKQGLYIGQTLNLITY